MKYRVVREFRGSVEVIVEADSVDEAREVGSDQIYEMSHHEFGNAAEIDYVDTIVEEY